MVGGKDCLGKEYICPKSLGIIIMELFRYLFAIVLGIFGIYIIIMNWCILLNNTWKKKRYAKVKYVSFGPFLGGISLCVAITIIPNNPYSWLCWLAFVIDFGSLPWLCYTLFCFATGKHKK